MKKLLQRLMTAIVLIAVLLVVFFALPPPAAVALLAAFASAAAWEWARMIGWTGTMGRLAYAGVTLAILALALWLVPAAVPVSVLLWLSLAWWAVALSLVLRFPVAVPRWPGALCGLLVLVPAATVLVILLRLPGAGPGFVLLALAVVWSADVGAYFTGRRIGRRKLAPRVSPGKTVEGVGGGLLAAALAASVGASVLGLPVLQLLPVGVIAAAVSVLGDLTVSLFKRNAGLKDSGTLFPGHGGVLDRIDSVTAGVPVFALGSAWLGVVAL